MVIELMDEIEEQSCKMDDLLIILTSLFIGVTHNGELSSPREGLREAHCLHVAVKLGVRSN